MKTHTVLLTIFLAVLTGCAAQAGESDPDSTLHKKKVYYYFNAGMAAMMGCEQCSLNGPTASFSFSTIHGVRIGKKLSVGAGFGFDAYERWKTLPVFGSASWDLLGKRNKLLVQLNYGYSGATNSALKHDYGFRNATGGKMINPSLGYRIQSGQATILLSVGYKFQRVHANYAYSSMPYLDYYNFAPMPDGTKAVQTDMNRFVIGMAIGWR